MGNAGESLEVFQRIAALRPWRAGIHKPIALVPTMGALHEGHASLVRRAREVIGSDGVVVATIFVNPTQFGPGEDFAKYPRTLEDDLDLLTENGADAAFVPYDGEMYPAGEPMVTVDPGAMGTMLEGAVRPVHFRGVCTVVLKLLNLIQPAKLVMGQKDYQQNAVLRRMIRDLDVPVEHIVSPTVREEDGLAMSSRNRYLNEMERARAVGLFEALSWAKAAVDGGERAAGVLEAGMKSRLDARGLVTQYAVVRDGETLQEFAGPVSSLAVALIAAGNGNTRLIDNMILL